MKLVAIKSFTYAGKRVSAGDIFEVKTDRDAKLLVGIKNARNIEGREDAKIPAPTKKLVEQASVKPETIIPEFKEEVKLPDPEIFEPNKEEPEAESQKEELKGEDDKSEEVKIDVTTNVNNNKRNYNKRK